MTTRKKSNLGDVLREKVQKSSDIASENVVTIENIPDEPKITSENVVTIDNQNVTAKWQNALDEAQAEINKLQSIVEEQKNLVSRLQDELEVTKKAALDLADSNSDLIQENQHLQQENTELKLKSQNKQKALPVLAQQKRDIRSSKPPENDFAANIYLY
ncbi:MAG TPA: hypothetical protein V6C58_11400 [Allocoleopsis sp.]